jgi:glucose-1-phosphate thymidylyltransferase
VIRGPAIIGRNTRIENSFVGSYTSIFHDCEVVNSEIDRCIMLEHSRILNVPARISDSLIGRYVTIEHDGRKPKTLKLNLGDHSRIWLP